jgi:cellulose synthase/poly-beta-1,6-N-acetylglucosamine synthase-like glycosyltransferase
MDPFSAILLLVSFVVLAQSLFALYMTCYSWEHPDRLAASEGPREFELSDLSFSVIVPARNEQAVIYDTVRRIWDVDYPIHRPGESDKAWLGRKRRLLEVLVVCHRDDLATIAEAERAARDTGSKRVRVVTFAGGPINKPHGLNVALAATSNDVVAVFDAEDDVHPDIFNVIATVMDREGVGIVQSGVQLMNFRSHWFAMHNCLEYYFWFKSRLHFHADQGMIPLGGNTVFIRRRLLERIGGWDEQCLTEDADVGIRLSALGEPIRVVYDADRVTREETPSSTESLIRQRTRWHQGFLQIIRKGDWLRLPKLRQRLLALITLSYPFVQLPLYALWPLAIVGASVIHVPIMVAMVTYLPLYALLLQALVTFVGARMFVREYGQRLPIRTFLVLVITFLPYQWLLAFSSARAVYREFEDHGDWEKTDHLGAHRQVSEVTG